MKSSDVNPSYTARREDVLGLIPHWASVVLDVGCSTGVLGQQIKKRIGAKLIGIEYDQQLSSIAGRVLDEVLTEDVEEMDFSAHLVKGYFDCIIFADVLEHLRDPWRVLSDIVPYLASTGVVIASIPNVQHYTPIRGLLRGHWPYRQRGIHDINHLRFFAFKNITDMFKQAGLEIRNITRNYRIVEGVHPVNRVSRWFAVPPLRKFVTFQYLIVSRRVVTE